MESRASTFWLLRSSTKMAALAMLSLHQVLKVYLAVRCLPFPHVHLHSFFFLGVVQIPMRSSVISRHIYSKSMLCICMDQYLMI